MQLYILFISYFLAVHPLHLSVCNITISETGKKNELAVKIFLDDFREAVYGKTGHELSFSGEVVSQVEIESASSYIFSNFSITDGKKQLGISDFKFKKKLNEDLAVWWYFEFDLSSVPKALTVQNSLMTDLFFDQKNITFVKYKNTEYAEMFDPKHKVLSIKLKK